MQEKHVAQFLTYIKYFIHISFYFITHKPTLLIFIWPYQIIFLYLAHTVLFVLCVKHVLICMSFVGSMCCFVCPLYEVDIILCDSLVTLMAFSSSISFPFTMLSQLSKAELVKYFQGIPSAYKKKSELNNGALQIASALSFPVTSSHSL